MKFNVLVVAAMVITSVNAKWYDKFLGRSGDNDGQAPIVSLELTESNGGESQEPDPNETGPTCNDLEAKLLDLYGNIRARNSRVCYGAPELYKILEVDMGGMVGNGKDGAETEVAQKSDENEVQESTYMRVEEWFRLYFKYKTELDQLRQDLADWLNQYFETWEQFLRKGCLATKEGRFSPENMLDDLLLVRWYYKTTQAQDTNESDADISDKQDDNGQEEMQESNL